MFNQLFVSAFSSNQNADTRTVLIRTQNVAFQRSNAANVDVFTNFRYQRNTFFFELCFQNFNVSDFASNSCVQNFVCERLETSVFCNEVSLAVNFQNDAVVAVDFGFDHAVSSNVACFFRCFNSTGLTHVFDCQLDVAVSFSQCFFAIHHACASTLTQLFYQGCGNFSHSKILGDVICPALNRTDIKVKKGAICRPPNQTCTTWSIRALPLHISRRRCVIFARSSRSLTDVSSREFSSLPPFCNSNYFGGVIKPYYSASTKLSSAWEARS